MNPATEVLIVGAGPTGLVLALWLTHLGVKVRIVDKANEPGRTSRALAVHARILEFYDQIDLADEIVGGGLKLEAVNLWVAGEAKARVVFGEMGQGISPFPYALMFPQDEHERVLRDRLRALGIEVEHATELIGFENEAAQVVARLRRPDGAIQIVDAAFIAGCDGAHSIVRDAIKVGFPGGTYSHVFYVADVEASGRAMNGELNLGLDEAEFLAIFPLKGTGRARFVGSVKREVETRRDLTFDDVRPRIISRLDINVRRVNWFSTYHVHHRVASQFRLGRAFLLGDAAHIHSPVGGQGMNYRHRGCRECRLEARRRATGARQVRSPRYLRAGAHCLRASSGRNHRPRLRVSHQRRGFGSLSALASGAAADAVSLQLS
jgi:2-polyprenyl-6-methoxyphenol hydroxylase-like FAD-dependent oxidoreductase